MCGRGVLTLKLGDSEIVELVRRHCWPNGVKCPYCGSSKVIKYGKAPRRPYLQRYFCTNCRRQFNDLTSTPLAEARVPPSTMLAILYHKLGLSQSAVARERSLVSPPRSSGARLRLTRPMCP